MKKNLFALTLMGILLYSCAPITNGPVMDEPTTISKTITPQVNNPISTTPAPADSNLVRGNVYLDSAELLTLESLPLQFTLLLKGNLPTPCDQLQVDVRPPDQENKVVVTVYSVSQPDKVCVQVLEPFEKNISLGSFPRGHYTLWVNGELATEFDA